MLLVQKNVFMTALIITAVSYFADAFLGGLPAVKPATVTPTEFSAERAMTILENLLQEGVPHPVGSEANKRVKGRIIQWLEDEGIQAEVQTSWGCSRKWNTCSWVENIIAIIPGDEELPYLALMAHYDSVPFAPGAGDDGAGVATVLEVGRMLKREGPFKSPILLLITDAEEKGLLGAEAFFTHHRLREKIGAIINVEGSGSTGVSRLLRTAMNNKTIVNAYGEGAKYPEGMSLASEIFRRMPNDTDFSVSMRARIPGIDFVFAGERNHYHTPNDNLKNLDLRTLQHHGENVLPLARSLASIDLGDLESSSLVFGNVFGQWIAWPEGLSVYLVVVSAILLIVAIVKSRIRPIKLVLGLAAPLVLIISCAVALYLNFQLIDLINGTTVSWPAHDLPFRVVLFATPAVVGFSLAVFLNKHLNQDEALVGLWCFWLVLAGCFTYYLPAAANLLIQPLVIASILIFVAIWVPASMRLVLQLSTLVFVIPASLGMVLTLEETQGYRLIVTVFFSLGIFFASIAPFVRELMVRKSIVVGALLSLLGTIGAVSMPLYSEWRPQHLNLHLIQDIDKNVAYWHAQTQHPLPEQLVAENAFAQDIEIYPWSGTVIENVSRAEVIEVKSPFVSVRNKTAVEQGYSLEVSMNSRRGANWLAIVLPISSGLISYELGNDLFEAKPILGGAVKDNFFLVFHGIQNKQVDLTLNFENSGPRTGYLMEVSDKLPGSAENLLDARQPLAAPVHRGDQFVLFQKIDL